ncbi:hypothetical protein [Amycolatopsis sp. PS_44_ISF1]|uniref:hypothetical protein n=1 Tax=Amycolatopsis sp. PS_44_ISF1 TaxID=2974917 RepID=UPI0028DF9326|nr:hypothetical protein [Amycolatopsis sp. PS_44_ISF1]MDT8910311.1 hypothetical protein [Amycolatopsis sp. PS_44_ISF1]
MFSIIMTWAGAVLGLTLLVAMAAGTFVVDFDEALRERRFKAAEAVPGPTSP